MKILKVPAINGLGMTKGTELFPEQVSIEGETLKLDNSDIEKQEEEIYNSVKNLEEKTVFIGGDHSISYPITKAFFEKNEELKLIVLDAHPDLMPPMQNPTHEEWLSAMIKEGIKPENILLIGARNIDPKEREYPVKTIAISELGSAKERIKEFAGNSKVYLSVDIDFFDKSIAPATGYPEDEGATAEEGLKLIEEIIKSTDIISADLVEVNPTKPGAQKTLDLAKEVLKRLNKI